MLILALVVLAVMFEKTMTVLMLLSVLTQVMVLKMVMLVLKLIKLVLGAEQSKAPIRQDKEEENDAGKRTQWSRTRGKVRGRGGGEEREGQGGRSVSRCQGNLSRLYIYTIPGTRVPSITEQGDTIISFNARPKAPFSATNHLKLLWDD